MLCVKVWFGFWLFRSNDDANGVFRIYSRDPRALDNGQTILIEERAQFSVELVVERTGLALLLWATLLLLWSVGHV